MGNPSGKRLLLVDDDERVRHALRRALERRGTFVVEAKDAREALDKLDDVAAVVTNWALDTGPTGVWLLERVMVERPKLTRVLYSGHQVPHLERLIDLGVVHAFLPKPLSSREIAACAFDARSGTYARLDSVAPVFEAVIPHGSKRAEPR